MWCANWSWRAAALVGIRGVPTVAEIWAEVGEEAELTLGFGGGFGIDFCRGGGVR